LKGARLQSHHDHRIAMAFSIAGLFATGETVLEDTACVNTSYPGFEQMLRFIQKGGKMKRSTRELAGFKGSGKPAVRPATSF
jgi:3-phosphoshikimate 1-carboxyvinyltransferase